MTPTTTHSDNNTVLIALLRQPIDWERVGTYGIYRVRGNLRHPPAIMKENRVRTLAFYLPAAFGKHKYSIQHFAKVKKMKMAPRYECVPDEPRNNRSNDIYYKFEIEKPQLLKEPIYCLRARRYMVLIPTTEEKFFSAPEINFCYNTSRLEENYWKAMLDQNIYPERQYAVKTKEKTFYILDFAIFCRNGRFAIEVDGPHHEANREAVIYDKRRDNQLSVEDWDGFRFVPEDLKPDRIEKTLTQINDKISTLKGLETAGGILPSSPRLTAQQKSSMQPTLFEDEHLSFLELRRRIKERFDGS